MYTLKQALHFLYPRIGHHWSNKSIGSEYSYLFAANDCLDFIYSYWGYKRSRLHYREVFVLQDKKILYLKTQFPISDIFNFYTTEFTTIHGWSWSCSCQCDTQTITSCNACSCDWGCIPINLAEKMPHEELCPWSYRIESSSIVGMWWMDGNVIAVMLPNWVRPQSLWVSYLRTPKHLKSYDDIVYLPQRFFGIFSLLMAEYIAPHYWQLLQWIENNYKAKAEERLQHLKIIDSHIPKDVILDLKREWSSQSKNTAAWQLISNNNIM